MCGWRGMEPAECLEVELGQRDCEIGDCVAFEWDILVGFRRITVLAMANEVEEKWWTHCDCEWLFLSW